MTVRNILTEVLIGAAVVVAILAGIHFMAGCGGTALPVTTVTISCHWSAPDGSTMTDNDCMIDRSSAEPTTTGQRLRIDPNTSVSLPSP